MIGVKNLSGQKLVAKFDGKDYTFEASDQVTTPLAEDAARHIFGYGEKDKSRALLRLGWVANGSAMDAALERLGNFQFLAVEEVKFKDAAVDDTLHLPRKVSGGAPSDTPLSKEELEHADKLAKPEGSAKQFARSKT